MVTRITTPQTIQYAIYYNERKVRAGRAECIHAWNFLKDAPELTLAEKRRRFDDLIALNQRIGNTTIHISVNFAPGEELQRETLIEIASEYMDRIGFSAQPYLVYKHNDAAHPHIHIVTTRVLPDGSYIDLTFLARDRSEPARKALEEKYGLAKAKGRRVVEAARGVSQTSASVQYGLQPTKNAIAGTLSYVFSNFRFRSLPELNAILKLYNLRANPGRPGSYIHTHRGLLYQMLNAEGTPVGVPIKASSIPFKPGLSYLEEKFEMNRQLDPATLQHTRLALDTLLRTPSKWEEFLARLREKQVVAIPSLNIKGGTYGLIFVNLSTKQALKPSDLGKGYSLGAILYKLTQNPTDTPEKKKSKSQHH